MKKILKLCAVLTVMFFVLSCFVACSNGGGSSGNPGGGTGQEDEATDDDENNEEVEGEDENYTFSRTVTVEMTGSSVGYYIFYDNRMKDENGNEVSNWTNEQTVGYFCPHPDSNSWLWAGYVEKENYYMVDMNGVELHPVAKVEIDDSTLTVTMLDSVTEKIQFSGFRIKKAFISTVGHVSGFWDPVKGFYYETTTGLPGLEQKTTRTYGELKWVEE